MFCNKDYIPRPKIIFLGLTFMMVLDMFFEEYFPGKSFATKVIWASTQETLSSGVCEQHKHRPACAYSSLISAFVIRFLESIKCKLATGEFSNF